MALAALLLVLATMAGGAVVAAPGGGEADVSVLQGDLRGAIRTRSGHAGGQFASAERSNLSAARQWQPMASGSGDPEKERSKAATLVLDLGPMRPIAILGRREARFDTAILPAGGNLTVWSSIGPPVRSSC